MSSRLFSGGTSEAVPIGWRPAGSGKGAPPQPQTPVRGAYTAAAESDLEAQRKAAYQQGLAAGEATAQQRALAIAQPVLQDFAAVVQELAAARQQARREAEESMVQLAIAIARRVLRREIATDPEAILGLVRSGMDRVSAREVHKLKLSPADAAVVQQNRTALALPQAVEIVADPALAPGSAVFETTRGELDLSTETQLAEIDRGFADLIHRRKTTL